MPSTFTSGLSLELQATGENSNTWGTLLNAVINQVDRALAQRVTIAVTTANVTLTSTQAEYVSLKFNGTLTGNRSVIFPTTAKPWLIENATSGSFTLTCKTSAGTGIVVPQGKKMLLMGDGTNIINAIDSLELSSILDANGNELVTFVATASAVNEIKITNKATGAAPTIGVGGEANIGIGILDSNGNEILILGAVAAAVNELTIANAATGNRPKVSATGETNVGIDFQPKGTGILQLLDGNGNEVFKTAPAVSSAVNEIQARNAATGNAPGFQATGGDTNINFGITPKGTGQLEISGLVLAQMLRGHLSGLTLSNNATDATNDIDIAAGVATAGDQSATLYLASALTKRLDAAWAVGTGNGGLDTGTIANNTYHVWLIRRSDTGVVDALFSLSATSPTMPTNYDQKRRIGSIMRESAVIVPFVQNGDYFRRTTVVLDIDDATPGTSAVTRTLRVPTGIVVFAEMNVHVGAGTQPAVYLSPLDAADQAPALSTAPLNTVGLNAGATSVGPHGVTTVKTNTSAQIRSRNLSNVPLHLSTLGWTDRRGRDD